MSLVYLFLFDSGFFRGLLQNCCTVMNFTALSKTALGSFVQHFRINCICTANPQTPTLLSLCFFENLSGSCLKVGVLFTLLLLSDTEGRSGVDIQ